MNLFTKRAKGKLKGFFSAPYEVRVPSGDSSPFFGNYVGQKYGPFDTQTCWNFALCEITESQLEIERSLGRFTSAQLKWFKDNDFIDEDGDFYLSRRWGAILSGVRDNGHEQQKGWELAMASGFIPFTMLPYSQEDAADEASQGDFVNEYFNKDVITKEMEAMGIQFLKRVSIKAEEFGTRWHTPSPEKIMEALKQGPLQIGVPVPGWAWNNEKVKWNGDTVPAHSVELYKYEAGSDYPYYIYDSYTPHLKRLSADYYIPLATRAVITARKEAVPLYIQIWEAIAEWFSRSG